MKGLSQKIAKSITFTFVRQFGANFEIKGDLQRQNKLISSERPLKILHNGTKIIKIGHAVLEIFNFKD